LELLAHRAVDPPPSSSLAEERSPLLTPPPCGGARFRRSQLHNPHQLEICLTGRLRNLLVMKLFHSLLDDEILVRRPETPVAAAVGKHCELVTAYPGLLATLVVPDRRIAEVARHVPPGASVPLSVITSAGAGGLLALARHQTAGVEIGAIESTLRDLDDLAGSAARVISATAGLNSDVPVFIELPYAPGWVAAVELIEAAGLYGKIDVSHPESQQVVEQLSILIEADLSFKITSPHQENWLVLLAAVEALIAGASLDDAERLIRPAGDDRIGTAVAGWDQATQSRVRRRVRRLGTARVQDVITALAANGEPPES
jgi:hypothetical protein